MKTKYLSLTIALDVEQDDTDYSSRGWQLHKLQRVKLRDSQQSDNILNEVYSWVINKKNRTTAKEKRSFKGVMEILGSV